jgi:hypothetical protein
MDPADDPSWSDATLPRPAIDPAVPPTVRDLLSAPGAPLTPASRPRPSRRSGQRRRALLPDHPERRELTVYGAVTGLTTAMVVAVTGATPWAVGVLIFQAPSGWQSTTGQYALLLSEAIVAVTMLVFGTRVARFGEFRRQRRAASAARAWHGRYLTGADLDARGRILLRRVQDAVDTVRSAEVTRADMLDAVTADAVLAAQEWDIAVALREHGQLRAIRAAETEAEAGTGTGTGSGSAPGSPAANLLARHRDAARTADESITSRVNALERYAAEVRAADAAYVEWRRRL